MKQDDRRKASLNRRDWLRLAGLGSVVLTRSSRSSLAGEALQGGPGTAGLLFSAPPIEKVRIGFVGVGGMGSVHVENLLEIEGVELTAVCDIRSERVEWAQEACRKKGLNEPVGYGRTETDFVRMCEEQALDLVYTATPWRWHVPVCVAAMNNGKHAATEVPAAVTLEECWQLVETAEKTARHCVMMENCNYGRREMLILNLVRKGLLGEILHGECGYLHDLRSVKFSSEGEGLWRRAHSRTRNGNLYPTHGLGPVAQCMDINRGDRFVRLVSMSSPSRGLQAYAQEHFPPGSPQRQETFTLGDVNVSLIQTALGRTIFVSHDTNLPRPYSRIDLVQGTKGLARGYPDQVYIEGRSPEHEWEPAESYYPDFEHPLWRKFGQAGEGRGHGSMDYIEDYRLIHCLRHGLPPDMDVYDAAALSAVSQLSEKSVAAAGQPMEFPDFTRGRWKDRPPLGIVEV